MNTVSNFYLWVVADHSHCCIMFHCGTITLFIHTNVNEHFTFLCMCLENIFLGTYLEVGHKLCACAALVDTDSFSKWLYCIMLPLVGYESTVCSLISPMLGIVIKLSQPQIPRLLGKGPR